MNTVSHERYNDMNMTIQDWGAVGEVIGAVAVVISLIYLAIQIRLNTQQIRQSIEATRLSVLERDIAAGNRIRELLLVNPELLDLFGRGAADLESLHGPERARFGMLVRMMFSEFHGAYIRQISVKATTHEVDGTRRSVDEILRHPGVRAWLKRADPDWREEFKHFVSERIAAIEAPGGGAPARVG